MNLKSYILSTCIACSLLACSNDDEPALKTIIPIVPDASLDLTVDMNKVRLKSEIVGDEKSVAWDYAINSLTLVACNPDENGAYDKNNYKAGQIVAVFNYTYSGLSEVTQSTGFGLLSGNTDFVLYANLPVAAKTELTGLVNTDKTKADLLALSIDLKSETEGNGLTMRKDLGTLNVVAGKNYLGFTDVKGNWDDGKEIYGGKIKLDRIVSCIQLGSLTLNKIDGCTGFQLKKVFLANVKGQTSLDKEIDVNHYWAGAFNEDNGYYKNDESVLKEALCIFDDGDIILEPGKPHSVFIPQFVYPNQEGESTEPDRKNYTVLVIEGLYLKGTTAPKGSSFYTIVVNDNNFSTEGDDVNGKHIASNYKYTIHVSINGDGTDKPYEKPVYANIGAKIQVAPWDIVEINNPPLD